MNNEVFMTVEQLAIKLDEIFPRELGEEWDNDGKMIITNPDSEVTRVLCALDCTSEAIDAARAWACNVIVTHHPLVFKPLGSVSYEDSVGKRVIKCIKNGISVLSYHTRLDVMEGGVNDKLAAILGMENVESFIPYGRIGDVEDPDFAGHALTFHDFLGLVAKRLSIDPSEIAYVRSKDSVKRVAVVSGCGKDEIRAAVNAGADTFVTGEVMHSHLIDCKELGLNLICATHYGTERIILPFIAEKIGLLGVKSEIFMFKKENEFGFCSSAQSEVI